MIDPWIDFYYFDTTLYMKKKTNKKRKTRVGFSRSSCQITGTFKVRSPINYQTDQL